MGRYYLLCGEVLPLVCAPQAHLVCGLLDSRSLTAFESAATTIQHLLSAKGSLPARDAKLRDDVCALQVRLLYGPLLACVTASKSAFTAMVRQHGNGDIETFVRAARSNPEGREGQIYRYAPGA